MSVTQKNILKRAGYDEKGNFIQSTPLTPNKGTVFVPEIQQFQPGYEGTSLGTPGFTPVPAEAKMGDYDFNTVMAEAQLWAKQNSSQWSKAFAEFNPVTGKIETWFVQDGKKYPQDPNLGMASYLNKKLSLTANAIPQQGVTSFNTGNPEMDNWLNNVWMPLIEAELSQNPSTVYDSEAFKKLAENVKATWEPTYQYEFGEAEKTFLRNKQEIEAQQTGFEKELGATRTRTAEDLMQGQQRIARNYDEAMADSRDAMTARNLAFGGTRLKAERQLGEAKTAQEQELAQKTSRTLEDLQREEELKTGQYGRQLSELEQGYGQTKKQLGEIIPTKTEEEKQRLLNLGGTLLQYPDIQKVLYNQ